MAIQKVTGSDKYSDFVNKFNNNADDQIVSATNPSNGVIRFTKESGSFFDVNIPPSADTVLSGVTFSITKGGQVTVSSGSYLIGGTTYTIASPIVFNLDAADANPRIDVIVVDTLENATFVKGTPAANPSEPTITATQLKLGIVIVNESGYSGIEEAYIPKGLNQDVAAATTTDLDCTYLSGVLTSNTNITINPLDDITLSVGDRILVKDQTDLSENGIYIVNDLGVNGVSPFILERAVDFASDSDIQVFLAVRVVAGTANAGKLYALNGDHSALVLDTNDISFFHVPTPFAGSAGANKLNASTGVISFAGFTITSPTTFDVGAIEAEFVDFTNPDSPESSIVTNMGETAQSTPFLATDNITYVVMDKDGVVTYLNSEPTPSQLASQYVFLGNIGHPDNATITTAFSFASQVQNPINQIRELMYGLGAVVKDGLTFEASATGMTVSRNAGTVLDLGIGSNGNEPFATTPNLKLLPAIDPVNNFLYVAPDGTNEAATVIDPNNYIPVGNDINNKVAVATNKYTIQYIVTFKGGFNNIVYGQNEYNSLDIAINQILRGEDFTFPNVIKESALIRAALIIKQGTAGNLIDAINGGTAYVFNFGKFGINTGGGGVNGSAGTTLQIAYENSEQPQILIDVAHGSVQYKDGVGSGQRDLIEFLDNADTVVAAIDNEGLIKAYDLQLSGSDRTIVSDNNSSSIIYYGSTNGDGANVRLHGSAQASRPNRGDLRVNTGSRLSWFSDRIEVNRWTQFQDTTIADTAELIKILNAAGTTTAAFTGFGELVFYDSSFGAFINVGTLSADRTINFPDKDGTVGLFSDITMQNAYESSVEPEILTDSTRGALSIRRGSASDTNYLVVFLNGAGTVTNAIDASGNVIWENSSFIMKLNAETMTANRTHQLPNKSDSTLATEDDVATLTDGATITWDCRTGDNKTVTLGGNRTLSITNPRNGMVGILKVVQDATGGRTLTLPAGSYVSEDGAGVIDMSGAAANEIWLLSFWYDGTNYYWNYSSNYTNV